MSVADITLSEDQKLAHDALVDFWKVANKKDRPEEFKGYITMGGFAGTGKTTTISKTVEKIAESKKDRIGIAFCALTGKASNVLRSKLDFFDADLDYCGTIHSLMYRPVIKNKIIRGWKRVESIDYDLIVVDEASMVNGEIFRDLMSYKKPIIAVGDHGQLPPISGDFNLMGKPDIRLETIHRQAADNPIIQLSLSVRKNFRIQAAKFGEGVEKVVVSDLAKVVSLMIDPKAADKMPLFLCAFNATRVFLNRVIRQSLGIRKREPVAGDRVICLRNNRDAGIYNGMTGVIQKISSNGKDTYRAEIKMDGESDCYEGLISKYQFGQPSTPSNWNVHKQGDLFDFGYCLTVHKSQGSESPNVVLIEQRIPNYDDRDFSKWLYTGITRAKETLLIITTQK